MASVSLSENKLSLLVRFGFDLKLNNFIKSFQGWMFDSQRRAWSIPASRENLEKIAITIPNLTGVDQLRSALHPTPVRKAIKAPTLVLNLPPHLKLRPFQAGGVRQIERWGGRALLADEMGLGKTIQALCWARLHPKVRPIIAVVEASTKIAWAREAKKWLLPEDKVVVINGMATGIFPEEGTIYIINYDIVPNQTRPDPANKKYSKIVRQGWLGFLCMLKAKLLILDEVHKIKNMAANRTKAMKLLSTGIPHIIGIGGTPIVNKPSEMWPSVSMIRPGLFRNWNEYTLRYCDKHKEEIWVKDKGKKKLRVIWKMGSSRLDELHAVLKDNVMIRRLKVDVLPELPPKVKTVIPLEIANRKEYDMADRHFLEWLEQVDGPKAVKRAEKAEKLVQIGKLKQLAVEGKLKAAVDWIENVIDAGEKLIVFCVNYNVPPYLIDVLMEKFKGKVVKLTGNETSHKRQAAIDDFQNNDKIRLFIGSQAAWVGITLTAASQVAFLELGWTPTQMDQAEDRAHRIGQTDSVNIYYLVAENTVEEDIVTVLDEKREVVSQVLDGKAAEAGSILGALLERMKARRRLAA